MFKGTLQIGPVQSLLLGEFYALPPRALLGHVIGGGAVIQTSNDGIVFVTVTPDANGNLELAAAFIQTTVDTATIRLVTL